MEKVKEMKNKLDEVYLKQKKKDLSFRLRSLENCDKKQLKTLTRKWGTTKKIKEELKEINRQLSIIISRSKDCNCDCDACFGCENRDSGVRMEVN